MRQIAGVEPHPMDCVQQPKAQFYFSRAIGTCQGTIAIKHGMLRHDSTTPTSLPAQSYPTLHAHMKKPQGVMSVRVNLQ